MVTFVLDASAILRYLEGGAGAHRVTDIFTERVAGRSRVLVSSVQWGEIALLVCLRKGVGNMEAVLGDLLRLGIEVVPATAERAVRAGVIKEARKIPYAGCFAVQLASGSPDHVLVTADLDLKASERDVRIEFLPKKTTRP